MIKTETYEENKRGTSEYPVIMISDNKRDVVLFTAKGEGFTLKGVDRKPGYFSKSWNMENFSIFRGLVTLSQ